MPPRLALFALAIPFALLPATLNCGGDSSTGAGDDGGSNSSSGGSSGGSSGASGSSSGGASSGSSSGKGGSSGASSGASSSSSSSSGASSSSSGASSSGSSSGGSSSGGMGNAVKTVFLIMEENHSATSIYGAANAPYINKTLLPMGAHVTNYLTHVHPSEPNYISIEAGNNLGVMDDNDPVPNNEQTTTDHVVSQLVKANLTWKAYVEDIDGKTCPLTSDSLFQAQTAFAVKHTPQLFFSDVTDNFSTSSATCIAHVRPYGELATDLANNTVAAFNFITPDLCDDMHGGTAKCLTAGVPEGDTWLQNNVPAILNSTAFKNGGLLLIVWDEGDEPPFQTASDGPLPMIAIGSMVKTNYAGSMAYTHASTTKSLEEIFGLPLLRDAANAQTNDLADLFTKFP